MKVKGFNCPHCGAAININIVKEKEMFCPYCGGIIHFDDEVVRTEHKEDKTVRAEYKEDKTININKRSENHYINEAKVQDAQNRKFELKAILVCAVLGLIAMLAAGIGGYYFRGKSVEKKPDNSITITFQNAILGKADEKMSLIVLEQDLSVTSTITKDGLFKWGVFQKNKDITYTGNAIYTVNLKELREHDIVVDPERKLVTIYAPRTVVHDVIVNPEDFKLGDTSKGLLSFGDIKFTLEEAFYIESEAIELLKEKAESAEQMKKATKVAEKKLDELFSKTVSGVDSSYKIKIVMD